MKNYRYLIITGLILILDQISKYFVRLKLPLFDSVDVFGKYFRLTHLENDGAAFSLSLGDHSQLIFLVLTVVILVVLMYALKTAKYNIQKIYYSLIIGGAIGNFIDRAIFGTVTDFLDSLYPRLPSSWNLFYSFNRWPTFNVADSAIVVGMILFAYDAIIIENKRKKSLEEA